MTSLKNFLLVLEVCACTSHVIITGEGIWRDKGKVWKFILWILYWVRRLWLLLAGYWKKKVGAGKRKKDDDLEMGRLPRLARLHMAAFVAGSDGSIGSEL